MRVFMVCAKLSCCFIWHKIVIKVHGTEDAFLLMNSVHIHKYFNEVILKVPVNCDRPIMDQCRCIRTALL